MNLPIPPQTKFLSRQPSREHIQYQKGYNIINWAILIEPEGGILLNYLNDVPAIKYHIGNNHMPQAEDQIIIIGRNFSQVDVRIRAMVYGHNDIGGIIKGFSPHVLYPDIRILGENRSVLFGNHVEVDSINTGIVVGLTASILANDTSQDVPVDYSLVKEVLTNEVQINENIINEIMKYSGVGCVLSSAVTICGFKITPLTIRNYRSKEKIQLRKDYEGTIIPISQDEWQIMITRNCPCSACRCVDNLSFTNYIRILSNGNREWLAVAAA